MVRLLTPLACALALSAFGCSKQSPPTAPPVATKATPVEDEAPPPEPEPKAPPRRVGDGAIAVGTFNLQWAHDAVGEPNSKRAADNRAKTDEDWAWKVDQIAKVLIAEKLDVIALQELGGSNEVLRIEELGGPEYNWAFVESEDRMWGHHVAILSRFDINQQYRFDIHLRRHVAAEIELPNGTYMTVVAVHAVDGGGNESARTKQARALRREVAKLRKEQPVVVLGTTNSKFLPDDDAYGTTSVGLLAGAATRTKDDDCADSAVSVTETTRGGAPYDRILSCGLQVANFDTTGESAIVRHEPDPSGSVWSAIPIEDAPFRDVSDHVIVWAELELPQPPAEEQADTDPSIAAP